MLDLNTKDEDSVKESLIASTRDTILFFTDRGKVYQKKMYELPEGKKTTKGKAVINFIPILQSEQVTSILSISTKDEAFNSVMLCTEKGIIKRLEIDALSNVRKTGIIALNLSADDKLRASFNVCELDTVMIHTTHGKTIRFKVSDIRTSGRTSKGVKGITLQKDDFVISSFCVSEKLENPNVLTISANGYGKLTSVEEYKIQNRGGGGIKTMEINDKTGKMISAHLVADMEKQVIAMSKNGQVIRLALSDIPVQGRSTQGVKIMKPKADDEVASSTQL